MKVLTIGTDRKLFEEGSAVGSRIVEYGNIFEELKVIVFNVRDDKNRLKVTKLSDNIFIHPTNSSSKMFYIVDAIRIGKNIIRTSCLRANDSVISTQDPFETGLVGLLLKLRYKLPLQIQLHTDFASRYFITHSILNLIRFPLGLFVLSFADSVRVVSERVAKSVKSLSNNVSVLPIYTGRNESRVKYQRLLERSEIKKVNILTVCRLEKEKDLETAIRVFKNILDNNIDAKFTIVGDGNERQSLGLLVKKLGIESKVVFTGWDNNLDDYYENADIYLSTSLYEGYGMSIVEAASFGLPLVISDTGVAGYMFKDQKEAVICKQKNIAAFTEAILKLISNIDLRSQMGNKAKKVSDENKIDLSLYLNKYKKSIEEALSFSKTSQGVFKKNILLRYLVSGIVAASTNIGLLYVFTDLFKLWYLHASIIAFTSSVLISFTLQKFWTFNDRNIKNTHRQFINYIVVAILGVVMNTVAMYLLVDLFDIWYILAQILTGILIAIFNFLMYKFFIFNR